MFLVTFAGFVGTFFMYGILSMMSENVTIQVRNQLYKSIIKKEIGFFDEKENAPGVISSTMANDTSTLNGAATDGAVSYLQSLCSLIVGIAIGCYYCW